MATGLKEQTITEDNLYQPDRFKVHVGTGTIGFCTVWNEAKAVITQQPTLLEKAALVGTLYSSQGVNVVLRNLALNPFIRQLYVWGHGTLSNTKFGVVGSGVLRAVWEQGVASDRSVPGTSFKLEEEIDRDIIEKIRANVELIDASRQNLAETVAGIQPRDTAPYMDPVRFPDAKLTTPAMFPSEKVGWNIRGRTVIEAWTRAVERIMRYGTVKGTQYGQQQKELVGLTWVITSEDPAHPALPTDWPQSLAETVGATPEAIEQYHNIFLSPDKPAGVSYTYGNRLMKYPSPDGSHIDQIAESIVRNLKNSPDSRRAVATMLIPWIDATSDEPPCINHVQALQSEGKLHLLVTARSHDIFRAAVPNAFGLRLIQHKICQETGFEMGSLAITSQSAHIYQQDWDNAKQLAACAVWERPVQKMYDAAQADPRGVFLIRVKDKKIFLDFATLDGQPLLQFEGRSADLLALEISKHELISQSGHALDIGIQLARAELAAKKGIEFVQDRPLVL